MINDVYWLYKDVINDDIGISVILYKITQTIFYIDVNITWRSARTAFENEFLCSGLPIQIKSIQRLPSLIKVATRIVGYGVAEFNNDSIYISHTGYGNAHSLVCTGILIPNI